MTVRPSKENEQALLGSCLIRPEVIPEITDTVRASDFAWKSHRLIFQAITDLYQSNQTIDLVTVNSLLRERGQIETIGGPVFLAQLSEQVGFAINGPAYAKLVRKASKVRTLEDKAQAILKACAGSVENLEDLLQYAESQIHDVTQDESHDDVVISSDILLKKEYTRETEIICGGILPRGGGLILAGEAGEGKSLLRLEIAIHIVMGWSLWGKLPIPRARRVLIFSFENTEYIEAYRLIKMLAGLRITNFPSENLFFSDHTIRIDLSEKKDIKRIIRIIRDNQIEVVFYDPLTSLHNVNENDNVKIRRILDNITEINRITGASSFLVHHFGKPNENSITSHRTRGASSIKDWADTLVALTRKKNEHRILRLLEFVKIRSGPEFKPLLLERDKESFLHHIAEDNTACPPEKVKEILQTLGGKVEGQEPLIAAISKVSGCKDRAARSFIKTAVERGLIKEGTCDRDGRLKTYYV